MRADALEDFKLDADALEDFKREYRQLYGKKPDADALEDFKREFEKIRKVVREKN